MTTTTVDTQVEAASSGGTSTPVKLTLQPGTMSVAIQMNVATVRSIAPSANHETRRRTFQLYWAFSPDDLSGTLSQVPTLLMGCVKSQTMDLQKQYDGNQKIQVRDKVYGQYLYIWFDYPTSLDQYTVTVKTTEVFLLSDPVNPAFSTVTISQTALGTTSTDGLLVRNTTVSTAGVPVQYSPRIHLLGHAWNTTSVAADNYLEMIGELRPVSGAVPSSNFVLAFRTSTDGVTGAYADKFIFTGAGNMQVGDGTAAAPSHSFNSDTTKGFSFYSANQIGVSLSGAVASYFVGNGLASVVGGDATKFLRGDGTWQTPSSSANLTGDVTSVGSVTTLANIPTAVPMAGSLLATNIAAPSTPASGKTLIYVDSTLKQLSAINDAGAIYSVARTNGTNTFTGAQTVTGGSLASTTNALLVTGTMSNANATQQGVLFNLTGSGTANQPQEALSVNLLSGYTGANYSIAGIFQNNSVATGTVSIGGGAANYGILSQALAVTSGDNVGIIGIGTNSTGRNIGLIGNCSLGGTTDIGVAGIVTAGTNRIAGYFTLANTNPAETAVLLADNGSTSANIFVGKNNTTTVLTIGPTGLITTAGGLASSSSTVGVGYVTGAGGTVTQITSRSTGVTLSKVTGSITTDTTSLAGLASASFVVTNTTVAISDTIILSIRSGQTNKKTQAYISAVAAGSFEITIYNADTVTAETGAIIINFTVIKGVTS